MVGEDYSLAEEYDLILKLLVSSSRAKCNVFEAISSHKCEDPTIAFGAISAFIQDFQRTSARNRTFSFSNETYPIAIKSIIENTVFRNYLSFNLDTCTISFQEHLTDGQIASLADFLESNIGGMA
jgi:hypothetical protein